MRPFDVALVTVVQSKWSNFNMALNKNRSE